MFRGQNCRADFLDAPAGGGRDIEPDVRVLDRVANHGRAAEQHQHEAADAIDFFVFERDVEVLSAGGLREDEDLFASVWKSVKNRWTWLAVNLVTAFIASRVIGGFELGLVVVQVRDGIKRLVHGIDSLVKGTGCGRRDRVGVLGLGPIFGGDAAERFDRVEFAHVLVIPDMIKDLILGDNAVLILHQIPEQPELGRGK